MVAHHMLINDVYLEDIIANINVFTDAINPSTSLGTGEIIYNSNAAHGKLYVNTQTVDPTTNPTWTEVGSGASGIWEDSGTLAKLITARETDFQGERIYLYKGASDADSTYFDIGATGNLIVHIATGKAVEWTVG